MQGEVGGLVEMNPTNHVLDAGDVEMPTILDAVEESAVVDFNPGGDDRKSKKYSKKKCHQGTQTEVMLPVRVAQEPVNETRL